MTYQLYDSSKGEENVLLTLTS